MVKMVIWRLKRVNGTMTRGDALAGTKPLDKKLRKLEL
jgi:hypothetical protein